MSSLPKSWAVAELGSIADVEWGNTSLTKSSYVEEGYPAFSASGRDGFTKHFEHSGPGIVLSAIGARCGKCFPADEKWTSIKNTITISDVAIERDFLFPFLNDENRWPQKGGAQPFITLKVARELQIPVAPVVEQHRIVAKIVSLCAKSKRSRGRLDHIPRLVEKYKQAILATAFRGELTRSWRAGRTNSISIGQLEDLRSNAWKAELKHGRVTGRYNLAEGIDWQPAIEIPKGWTWASVDQASFLIQYGSSAKTSEDSSGVAVLRMGNIQYGNLDLTSIKFLPEGHEEFPALLLENGDVLFNRTNSAELVGKTAVYWGKPQKASFASYLIRVRCCGLLPILLSGYINSAYGRDWVASVVNQQVGQANVNGTKLRQLGIPIMPLEEQFEIARRIEIAFAWVERLASETTGARKLIDHLEQAVLAKAFRGELVPQNPNDEPASMLLERIKAERRVKSRTERPSVKKKGKARS
jgi:type I restriction enzyme S subunit